MNPTARRASSPTCPKPPELVELYKQWRRSPEHDERAADLAPRCSRIYTDQVFSIGIVNGTHAAGAVRRRGCSNVPDEALYGFEPTCYFGVYMPDTFWFDDGEA